MKFKTVEEAQKAFDELIKKHEAEVKAHGITKGKLEKAEAALNDAKEKLTAEVNAHAKIKQELIIEIDAHERAKKELKTAQEIAEDAVSKANEAIEKSDPNVYATFNKDKYRINFAVDNKTKEEIRDDQNLVSHLVKIGSGALTKV